MTVKDLEILFDYGYWANEKLFQLITQLTPEQFALPVGGSYGSIRNTLVHALSAEWGWLDRCGGPERIQSDQVAAFMRIHLSRSAPNQMSAARYSS